MTAEAKKWIGFEKTTVSDIVTKRLIREYTLATGDDDPLFLDPEYAATTRYGGLIAPPLFHSAATRRVVPESRLLPDGQYDDLAVPGISGRSMAGSREIEFFNPVRPGDIVTEKMRITDIYEKSGRSGNLVFQISEVTFTNQRGELLAVEKHTLIFR